MPRLKDVIRHRLAPVWEKTIAASGQDLAGRDAGNTAIIAFGRRVLFLPLRDQFQRLRIDDDEMRELFGDILRRRTQYEQKEATQRVTELNRELTTVQAHLDQLLNLRMLGEIKADEYARKKKELRSRQSNLTLQVEALSRSRDENAELAVRAFELSQSVSQRWVSADQDVKRRLIEILCLNLTLDGASLVPEWRKPFDVLAEGPSLEKSRGERIRTSDLLTPSQTR
jgi:site-specific DNA recombinase